MRTVLSALRWTLALVGVTVGILLVRDLTQSTHSAQPPDSRLEVVVDADSRAGEPTQALHEMTTAQVVMCRLEVSGDPVGDVVSLPDDPTRFRVVLQPALDETDRTQYRGCLEDWRIDHLRLRVISMARLDPASAVG